MQNKKILVFAGGLTALLLVTAVAISHAATQSFYVPSGSMLPGLPVSSTISVKLNAYQKMSDVKRGDVIVHTRAEKGQRIDSIKRVIGLPGDKIAMSGTAVKVNGVALPHTLVGVTGKVSVYTETNGAAKYQVQYGDNVSPATPWNGVVPAGQLFCAGDNRDNSYDSRYLGSVLFGDVLGKKVP